jgi:hypothetical protein
MHVSLFMAISARYCVLELLGKPARMEAKGGLMTIQQGWIFTALVLLALLPRLYSAQTIGWDWDHPGSFTLINFDEGGSCRAAMNGFSYSTFVGRQTIAIASVLGRAPDPGISGGLELLLKITPESAMVYRQVLTGDIKELRVCN